MIKRFLTFFVLLIVISVVFGLVYTLFFVPHASFESILQNGKAKCQPVAVFLYESRQDKQHWRELMKESDVSQRLTSFIHDLLPASQMPKGIADVLFNAGTPGFVLIDYKERFVQYRQGIPEQDELRTLLNDTYLFNETLLEEEKKIGAEFEDIKTVFQKGKYILAMERLGTFIALYGDSAHVEDARRLLTQVSYTDAVKQYQDQHRDKNNRKVLLHEAEKYYQYKRYFNANHAISLLLSTYRGSEEAKKAEELKQTIEKEIADKFKAATMLYRHKKFDEVMDAYLSLNEQLRGTHWQLFVSGKIKQLRGDKEYLRYLEQAQQNREAKSLYRKGEKLLVDGKWDLAEHYYSEIIRFHSESDYFARARQRIMDIEKLRYDQPHKKDTKN